MYGWPACEPPPMPPRRYCRACSATIVPLFFRRLPGDSAYLMRFHPPLPDLPEEVTGGSSILETIRPGTPMPKDAPTSAAEEKPAEEKKEEPPAEDKKPFWDRERTQQLRRPTQDE